MRIIRCEECGSPRLTRYKNTKYCHLCRLSKNLEFIGDRTNKCAGCEKSFAPIDRNEQLCPECSIGKVAGDPRGTCAFCEAVDAPLIREHIAVCVQCAHDPKLRTKFVGAIAKKISAIKRGDIEIPEPEIPQAKPREVKNELPSV